MKKLINTPKGIARELAAFDKLLDHIAVNGKPVRVDKKHRVKLVVSDEKREEMRAAHRLAKYGLEAHQYEAMFKQQQGLCSICLSDVKLVVDHDHRTGEVRDLLCGACNTGLGSFKDDAALLLLAAAYLKRHAPKG